MFDIHESLGHLLNRSAIKIKNSLFRSFKAEGYDLTADHWLVLNCLWAKDGISQTELSELSFKERTNLTRILDVMEKNKLISRKPNENDRRSFKIFLTEYGKNLESKLITIAQKTNAEAIKGLKETDVIEIKRILNTILNNL